MWQQANIVYEILLYSHMKTFQPLSLRNKHLLPLHIFGVFSNTNKKMDRSKWTENDNDDERDEYSSIFFSFMLLIFYSSTTPLLQLLFRWRKKRMMLMSQR